MACCFREHQKTIFYIQDTDDLNPELLAVSPVRFRHIDKPLALECVWQYIVTLVRM
jgi:hypothetical protein